MKFLDQLKSIASLLFVSILMVFNDTAFANEVVAPRESAGYTEGQIQFGQSIQKVFLDNKPEIIAVAAEMAGLDDPNESIFSLEICSYVTIAYGLKLQELGFYAVHLRSAGDHSFLFVMPSELSEASEGLLVDGTYRQFMRSGGLSSLTHADMRELPYVIISDLRKMKDEIESFDLKPYWSLGLDSAGFETTYLMLVGADSNLAKQQEMFLQPPEEVEKISNDPEFMAAYKRDKQIKFENFFKRFGVLGFKK